MITKLIHWKLVQESKLVPRNLDNRKEKLRQQNLLLLQNEVIEVDELDIDNNWNFLPEQVKVKKIIGNVSIMSSIDSEIHGIPKWLKNVKIDGTFDCSHNKLTSLEGCPQEIKYDFYCDFNKLLTLIGGPNLVYGRYTCYSNNLTNLEGCAKYVEKKYELL